MTEYYKALDVDSAHCCPHVLHDRDASWCVCACGWTSPRFRRAPFAAEAAWADHVVEKLARPPRRDGAA